MSSRSPSTTTTTAKPRPRRAKAAREEAEQAEEPEPEATLLSSLPAKALPARSRADRAKASESEAREPAVGEEATPVGDEKPGQAARRAASRTAQRADSQAAFQALKNEITEARRKALSTLTGAASVSMLGLVVFGLIGGSWKLMAFAAMPLLLMACFLCWRRDRALTEAEYLSLPHSQARNARLRCIHCWSLGVDLREARALNQKRLDCPKCGETLFAG